MQVDADRERYLKQLENRLYDRFLERPALLDLKFIRLQIENVDSLIAAELAKGREPLEVLRSMGEPKDYANQLYERFLAGAHGPDQSL